MNDTILKLENLTKEFPGVVALDNVSLEIRKGEVHVLLGENGAGKSTLVKILSGAYKKDYGKIYFCGEKIEIKNPKHSQELGIGVIYQEFNLIPHLTVAENIFLGREKILNKIFIDRDNLNNNSDKILKDLGVEINSKSLVGELGIAQQQMVEVAKALSMEAKILIMDEPTSALTENEINELFAAIERLKANGVSIIYISHRLEELYEIGDRVTILRDGKYIGTHEIKNVSKPELIKMMVDRELKEQYPKQKAEIGSEVLSVKKININNTLRDITFSLHEGEVLGIFGLLGSGRTELARALFGLDKIDSGEVSIHRRNQNIKSPRQAISLGIGFLTEDRKTQGLVLNLSLKENISLPNLDRFSKFGVLNLPKENSVAENYIKELRIKSTGIEQKVVNLSGGNQQKVVFSKWLCSQADIFIFDEPTRGIDVGSKVEIYNLMNRLTSQGVAIIMISSELPELLGMSDRILVMHENKISGEFDSETARQEQIMESALGA